MKMMLANS